MRKACLIMTEGNGRLSDAFADNYKVYLVSANVKR